VGEVIARGKNVMAGYWQDEEATAGAIRDGWFHTGDLGRFDEDGNSTSSGAAKKSSSTPTQERVSRRDRELYKDCPYIRSCRGRLARRCGEHVACAVVPDREREPGLSLPELKQKIENHFRTVSASLPFWKRYAPRVLGGRAAAHRLAQVRRRDVTAELRTRLRKAQAGQAVDESTRNAEASHSWFLEVVADACGRPYTSVHMASGSTSWASTA